MKLTDVYWQDPINILIISCCGYKFEHPANYSLVKCPYCGEVEYWHDFDPKTKVDFSVMENFIA